MNWIETETRESPTEGLLLRVSLAAHPTIEVKSVIVRVEKPHFQSILSEVTETAPTGSEPRLIYQVRLPAKIKVAFLKVRVNFRGGAPYLKTIPIGSAADRFVLNLQLWLEKKKLKAARRAKRRQKKRPRTWDAFGSRLTSFFLRRIWCRWVRIRYQKKALFFTISNPERIGHLASESEIFFGEIKKGIHPKGKYCLVLNKEAYVQDVGNVRIDQKLKESYLLKMLKRQHPVVTVAQRDMEPLAHRYVARRAHQQRDIHGVLDLVGPQLSFTKKEMEEGWRQLGRLGLTPDTPFVCLHLRESGYVHNLYKVDSFPKLRYSYRDVTAESYVPAIQHLLDQGLRIVRLGVPPVMKCPISDERYIDYANMAQNSFLDLFLCAQCYFFLGTTSGLYAVADLFRRPILYTNFAPLRHIHSWSVRYLTVPKVAYYRRLNRLLTFEEMLLPGLGDVIHGEKIEHLGIDYLANTEEEILEATKEMLAHLRNEWRETPERWNLQQRFWNMIPRDDLNQAIRARVGTHFLQKYRELLPPQPALPAYYEFGDELDWNKIELDWRSRQGAGASNGSKFAPLEDSVDLGRK